MDIPADIPRAIDRCIALVRHHADGLDAAQHALQAALERAGNTHEMARDIAATARRVGEPLNVIRRGDAQ